MSVFLDTSVLLAGLIDFGPQSAPAQLLLHAVAEKRVTAAATAWHCCLEFFSVATRLPNSGSRRLTLRCSSRGNLRGWPCTTAIRPDADAVRAAAATASPAERVYGAHAPKSLARGTEVVVR